MLVLPVNFDFDNAVEKERKKGGIFGTKDAVVWKRILWWPYLECVLNMEPYHTNRKIAIALAVDWTGVENADGTTQYDNVIRGISLVNALLSMGPPDEELIDVASLPEQDLIVPENVSLAPDNSTFSLCSEALQGCRDMLLGIWHGKQVVMRQNDPGSRFYQAIHQARPVIEALMLPEGYEREEQIPEERKVAGITTENLLTHGSLRDKGYWMIQSQRPFWMPILVVHYSPVNYVTPYRRFIVYDRNGKRLLEKRGQGKLIPWVAQLEEHQALDRTVSYLCGEFGRLDKERMSGINQAERDAVAAQALAILDQLDRLLPSYNDLDRKLRFDLFCSAAMFCHSVNNFSRGVDYSKAALELAPNDGRPHLCYALNAAHSAETRDEAVQSGLKAVRLPYLAEDVKTVSDSLELLKYCLEREREEAANSLLKLAKGAADLFPSLAEKLFCNSGPSSTAPIEK